MSRTGGVLPLVAGFAVPTVALVTALHLQRQPTLAEGVDGVVSGLAFAAFFAAGAALARGVAARRIRVAPGAAVAVVWGAVAAAIAWTGVWAMWQALPFAWREAKAAGFALNGGVVAMAGAVAVALAWGRSGARTRFVRAA